MTFQEAKQVPIISVCERLGAKRVCLNLAKSYALFHAPYRTDVHPSMMVNLTTNRWTDMALNESGDVVDLVGKTLSFSPAESLSYLSNGDVTSNNHYSPVKKKKSTLLPNCTIMQLTHPALISYVTSRGISLDLANRFCIEMHSLTKEGKSFFVVAFPSKSGGYEQRNHAFKGCVGPKDISVIGSGNCFLFFEGFFDFLSHQQLYGCREDATYVVLNSVSLTARAANYVAVQNFCPTEIQLWLDNDEAGRAATALFRRYFPRAVDMSHIYDGFDDLNAYLIHKK